MRNMRPVFCGNIESETRQSELEQLFSRFGRIDRIDMKSGFAFVHFEDGCDAEDAIRALDNRPFGHDNRRLSVEWSRGERGRGRHVEDSKPKAIQRPTKTLFVINFDPVETRVRDVERHFERYGKILHVNIKRNFAFVEFETQEGATKAWERTHKSKILDRVVRVEYALRDHSERGNRCESPLRRVGFGRGAESPYRRSPSLMYRWRSPSPEDGPASSPAYDRYNGYDRIRLIDYGRYRSRSPVHRSRE